MPLKKSLSGKALAKPTSIWLAKCANRTITALLPDASQGFQTAETGLSSLRESWALTEAAPTMKPANALDDQLKRYRCMTGEPRLETTGRVNELIPGAALLRRWHFLQPRA